MGLLNVSLIKKTKIFKDLEKIQLETVIKIDGKVIRSFKRYN